MERARQFLHVPPSSHVHVSHVRCARSRTTLRASQCGTRSVCPSATSALGSSRLKTEDTSRSVGRSESTFAPRRNSLKLVKRFLPPLFSIQSERRGERPVLTFGPKFSFRRWKCRASSDILRPPLYPPGSPFHHYSPSLLPSLPLYPLSPSLSPSLLWSIFSPRAQ